MNIRYRIPVLVALLFASPVGLTEPAGSAPSADTESDRGRAVGYTPGRQTEVWLNRQARGEAASHKTQSASAAERERANRRLLESYQYPIPEFFEQDVAGEIGD